MAIVRDVASFLPLLWGGVQNFEKILSNHWKTFNRERMHRAQKSIGFLAEYFDSKKTYG